MNANPFQEYLEFLHQKHANVHDGAVASYIPELLKADPAWFGIALVTVDGQVYQVGDSRQPFTIQSISKAVTMVRKFPPREPAIPIRPACLPIRDIGSYSWN